MKETVMITGSSSGLGMETALFLAERGFHVYATMRDPRRATPLEELARQRGVVLSVLPLDVTKPETIQKAVHQILKERGGLHGVVNNAGIQARGFFEDMSEQEMRDVFETNFLGTLAVTRAVLPGMRAAKRGRLVLMGSVGGTIATMGSSAYCTSKFALEGYGEALYQELQPFNIHVSIIEPGFVNTELFGKNRRISEGARDPESPYFEWFQGLERVTDERLSSKAIAPQAVARMVYKALEAKRPRLRYVVGSSARGLLMARRLLPWDLFERLYAYKVCQLINRSDPAR